MFVKNCKHRAFIGHSKYVLSSCDYDPAAHAPPRGTGSLFLHTNDADFVEL